jgi:type III secretion system YscQ/HrcQ family protein
VLDAWVRLDGRSFRLALAVRARELPQRRATTDVSARFELVAGSAQLCAAELASLRIGDVVLPGSGWFNTADPRSTVVAAAAQQEIGFRLQVSDGLRYVGREHLPLEREVSPVEDATKESLIAELPLVVRLEIGSVTMSVRECLALRPGDVVSCGKPPLDVVVLRTAGREVARGELVTVDGEVGVRITEITQADTDDTRPGGPPVEDG